MERKYLKIKSRLRDVNVTLETTYDKFIEICDDYILKNGKLNIRMLTLEYRCNECGEVFSRIYSNILNKNRGKECLKCLNNKR